MSTPQDSADVPAGLRLAAAPGSDGGDQDLRVGFEQTVRSLSDSDRLRRRYLTELPLRGSDAVVTDRQGRSSHAFTPTALADLISSIADVGQLQAVLLEDIAAPAHAAVPAPAGGRYRLVAGERRLRAMRWGATAWPDHPHFAALTAVVCPGPLTEEERRRWQLAENLAREDLPPGDLGAALLLERCAMITARMAQQGIEVPAAVTGLDDPVQRFAALERLRAGRSELAAPWREVVVRLGVQLSPRKARAIVAAFRVLPRELSAELDAHDVALATRCSLLQVAEGQPEAAAGLWEAVKARGRPDLLAAAANAQVNHPALTGEQAVEAAEQRREEANAARAAKLTASAPAPASPDLMLGLPTDLVDQADGHTGDRGGDQQQRAAAGCRPHDPDRPPNPRPTKESDGLVDDALIRQTLRLLRELVQQLHHGRRIDAHTAGSLRLLTDEISLLAGAAP